MKDDIPKKEVEEKVEKLLDTITNIKVKSQTKIKIISLFVSSQITFELKL